MLLMMIYICNIQIIMRKRKRHTDTMQKAAEAFGDFGHREDKVVAYLRFIFMNSLLVLQNFTITQKSGKTL